MVMQNYMHSSPSFRVVSVHVTATKRECNEKKVMSQAMFWSHRAKWNITARSRTNTRSMSKLYYYEKNSPTTWLLRRIIRRNFETDSRGTFQQAVKQQKWWKNSTKNKRKEEAYNAGYSQAVTHPSTNPAGRGLTSVIRREPVCFFFLSAQYELYLQVV